MLYFNGKKTIRNFNIKNRWYNRWSVHMSTIKNKIHHHYDHYVNYDHYVHYDHYNSYYDHYDHKNIQATISAIWLATSMSINPRSMQRSEIYCKKLKVSAKKCNGECKKVKLKVIDSSHFELGQTKWRTKFKRRLKLFI